jgi:hypothetical protein
MNTKIIANKKDGSMLFDELFSFMRENKYVFRGVSNKNELNPSLVRNYMDFNLFGDLNKYESSLLKEYGRYATRYISNHLTPIDWVASAQHYGLPTRLIDWSFNPFCALFFSVAINANPEDGVYRIYMCKLEDNMYFEELPTFDYDSLLSINYNNDHLNSYSYFVTSILNENGFMDKSYKDELRNNFVKTYRDTLEDEKKSGGHKLMFCKVYESNPRIIAQDGLFQIPRRFYNRAGTSICIKEDIEDSIHTIFEINKDLRSFIIDNLNKINVNTPRLFPDLASICTYIKYNQIDTSSII